LVKIIVTLGGSGAKHKDLVYGVQKKETIDVSGAGDTFLAAFAYKYSYSNSVPESIKFANEIASIVVTKRSKHNMILVTGYQSQLNSQMNCINCCNQKRSKHNMILVTGYEGFIGSRLMSKLKSLSHECLGLDLNEFYQSSSKKNESWKTVLLQFLEFHKPKVVFHVGCMF
jgi:hypothetical protein